MVKNEDIISYDIQGWPIYRMNIREILKSLGCELKNGKWEISDNDPRLDIYPKRFISDCMGYGIEEQNITDVNVIDNYCNIFTEPTMNNIELWNKAKFHNGADVMNGDEKLIVMDIKEENNELFYFCKKNIKHNSGKWYSESELSW